MIEVTEHFYDDDPLDGHPDVRTRLAGVSYFFLGNGLIQAAVQFAPDGEGTPLGLLIMNPERFGKKRDALTMDPALGLEATAISIAAGAELASLAGRGASTPPVLTVEWTEHRAVPAVLARWSSAGFDVVERFYCPDRSTPRLAREVTIRTGNGRAPQVRVRTGVGAASVELSRAIPAGGETRTWLLYTLDGDGKTLHVAAVDTDPLEEDARRYWTECAHASFGDALLDRWFNASRWQLPSVMSRHGHVDGGMWQYNREWVRDQALLAVAALLAGHRQEAATILRRLLREFVTADGATLDSSEVRGPDEVELDQNGVLLYALHQYVNWTGDLDLVAGSWDRVVAVADFPLRSEFRHVQSGMLHNAREFWERHAIHGIEPGLELTHQLFVSIGLSSAAALARILSHEAEAGRWERAANALARAMLTHPAFALLDARGFIKRRRLDGSVQERIVPSSAAQLPSSVPLAGPGEHLLNPDTSSVLPIVFGCVEPSSREATSTLAATERLWNQAWSSGGYGRYDVSSEPDSPGGWPFASLFVARAAIEVGQPERAWRVIRWLDSVAGAASGAWFEFYGERVAPPFPQVGIVPWAWAEMLFLLVFHVLGVRPDERQIRLRPHLLPGLERVTATLPIRGRLLHLEVTTSHREAGRVSSDVRGPTSGVDIDRVPACRVDGRPVEAVAGEWLIPHDAADVCVEIELCR